MPDTGYQGRPVYLLAGFGARFKAYAIDGLILTVPVLGAWALVLPPVIGHADNDRRLHHEIDAFAHASSDAASSLPYDRLVYWFAVISLATLACWWVILAIYSGWFMSRTEGQTPGMRAAGIRVMRADGRHVGFWWAITRTVLVREVLFGLVSLLTGGLLTVAQYLWPLWDHERRALHDIVARSRVVQDARPTA